MSCRVILTTSHGLRIAHVHKDLRERGMAFLESHYTGAAGNQGFLYVVLTPDNEVLGATLLGSTVSESQTRDIIGAPWHVIVCKRLFCADSCPIPESQLLRASMRDVANRLGHTYACAAYADPAARSSEGLPLTGWVYLAAGFALAGETSSKRSCLIDQAGQVRSTRSGPRTYTKKTMPAGWTWVDLPPARLWLAIVTPEQRETTHGIINTTQRWRKHQWHQAMAALPEKRRLAVRQWMDMPTWRRLEAAGAQIIHDPKATGENRGNHFRQAAWLRGGECNRGMAPIWVPLLWQQSFIFEEDVAGERTAACHYLPRRIVLNRAA